MIDPLQAFIGADVHMGSAVDGAEDPLKSGCDGSG
jgi:hypothetical protein